MTFSWTELYAQRARGITASEIRELLKISNQPGILSFGGGIPASELFPYAEVEATYDRILQDEHQQAQALQYSLSEGYPPLRELILEKMRALGLHLTLENVFITNGSQQALDFLGQLFINHGDHVIVENPSYLGALQAFNINQPAYLTVPIDEHGMCLEQLERLLNATPKFIYTIPNFQNPSGATLSLERRYDLVQMAHEYSLPIIEDNAYGELFYDDYPLPSLLTLDAHLNESEVNEGRTIYLGSASKVLAPGFRVAWVVAPKAVINRLVLLKQGADLHTSTINQMVVHDLMRQPFYPEHLNTLRRVYKERRDAMLNALAHYFSPEIAWNHPLGGMFIWVKLPVGINTSELLQQALQEIRVAFVPGAPFFADRSGINTLRLNFSMMPPAQIEEGIRKLGWLLAEKVLERM